MINGDISGNRIGNRLKIELVAYIFVTICLVLIVMVLTVSVFVILFAQSLLDVTPDCISYSGPLPPTETI